nr:unnamed protein product [Callosobruchus chinensis]
MPILSKKPMRKAIKKPFKPPIQAKDKIDKILGKASLSQKGKAAETVDNDLNDSVCTTSTGISSRLNEPAIKKMYMDFTVNMSKQIISSTPLPSSQDVKDDDLANMSFKDHMLNVLNNSEPIGIVSDEEQKKDNCETSVSLSQEMLNRKDVKQAYMEFLHNETDNEDFDFMKNFKNTKPNKKIFSSFEMNEKDEQKKKTDVKPTRSKKPKKVPVEKGKRNESKVDKPEQIKEFAGNKESTPKEVTEKNKKQRKPRVQKKKTPEENKAKEKESLKKLETGKGKSSNKTLAKIKRADIDDQDSGVCTEESILKQISSEIDDVQVAGSHRKLHTRALSTISEESNVSSKQVANEQQILVCNNSLYDLGTVVWAKIEGYPWWPAMVDDDPDFGTHIWVEEGSKEPTWYHVAFFDTQVVTRAWVQPDRISAYNMPIITPNKCQKMYAARLKGSIKQAEQALEMSWSGRIAKYGFVVRYPHGVGDLQKEREKKQRQDKIKEEKRQRRKKIYLELLKKKVAKSHKNDERKKKKSLLRLYSTGVGEELQNCVDSMFNLQGKQGNIDEITEMLEMEIQNDIVSSNSQENISETSIDMLETAN